MHASTPLRQALLAVAALGFATLVRADEPTFSAGLTGSDRDCSGLAHLSTSQLAVLDGLVQEDVASAHAGGVTGFSTGFVERHWAHERGSSGLDQLSAAERAALDRLTARAIALGPPPNNAFTWQPPKKTVAPAVAVMPAAKATPLDSAVSYLKQLEVHGDVSFTVGGSSHGGSFYGTSSDIVITDPTHTFSVAVGVDDYHGKGPLALYNGDYPYYPYGFYGPFSPVPGPGFWNW